MRRFILAGAALLALAVPAAAQDVGDAAPAFTLETWINGQGEKTLADFEGKCVMLEIWATW